MGAFAKGPVILVHLLPVALLMPWWARTQIGAVLRGLAIAVPVGTAIVAVWLVPAILVGGPDYRDAVLWSQSAGRMTNSFAHVQPWWFFLAALPLLLWPWAWSADVWRAVRSARRSDGGLRLSAAWALSALALFSLISGKQIHYLLPALPAVALALARALGDARVRAPLAGVLPALLGAALVAVAFGAAGAEPAALARPGWVAALVGVALIGLGAASLRVRGGGVAALGLAAPPVAALMFALGSAGPIYDAAPIGRLLAAHEAAGVAILANEYHGEFSYAGRLTRPLTVFDDLSAATDWLDDIPGRALLARLDKPHPNSAPAAQVVYRNRPYGLWTAAPARPDPGEPAA